MTSFFVEDGADRTTRRADRRDIELVETFQLNHNAHYFRFRFVSRAASQLVGLPPGRHLRISAKVHDPETDETVDISRSYTPIVDPDRVQGDAQFVIKIYPPMAENRTLGLFSRHMSQLKVGDRLQASGPWGKIYYLDSGRFQFFDGRVERYGRVALVAGGVGITPIICLVRAFVAELRAQRRRRTSDGIDQPAIHDNDNDDRAIKRFSLLYTNKREEDILFREELEGYAREFPDNFRLLLTLTAGEHGEAPALGEAEAAQRWRAIVPADSADEPLISARDGKDQSPQIFYRRGRIDAQMLADSIGDDGGDGLLVLVRGRKEMRKMVESLCEDMKLVNIH